MNILDLVEKKGLQIRKVANTKGGEYHGECPGCGGRKRFHVWPEQNDGQGSYWCRDCGKGGDLIQFIIDFEGKNFREACAWLGVEIDAPVRMVTPHVRTKKDTQFSPAVYKPPVELWQEKAEKFVSWCHEKLMANDSYMRILTDRGITPETMVRYRLGYNPGEKGKDMFRPRESWGLSRKVKSNGRLKMLWLPRGIVIPYIVDNRIVRIRIRRPKAHMTRQNEIKYYVVPGSSAQPMILNPDRRAFVVVEAELDALLTSQKAGDLVGSMSMGSSHTKPDQNAYKLLHASLCIINALDFDKAGAGAWGWWKREFPQARRRPVPLAKDPGDAVKEGVDLRAWVLGNLPPAWRLGLKHLVNQDRQNVKKAAQPVVENIKQQFDITTLPVSVRTLGELLKKYPVRIKISDGRITILEDKRWASNCWERSREVSNLVFFDDACFDYLIKNPNGPVIGGFNFFYGDQ